MNGLTSDGRFVFLSNTDTSHLFSRASDFSQVLMRLLTKKHFPGGSRLPRAPGSQKSGAPIHFSARWVSLGPKTRHGLDSEFLSSIVPLSPVSN